MKWKVLITAPYFIPVIERYREIFDQHQIETIVPEVKEKLSEEELLKYVKDIDGIICGDDEITERVLKAAPQLKVISKWGTGIDSIDIKAANLRGIPVRNTPNAFTDPVADTVLAYVLYFARRINDLDKNIRQGLWQKQPLPSLKELVLGVVGVGNIGRAVVKRARAFGMQVLGNDIKKISPDFIEETGLKMVSLEELLSESDFVSLNCDLNPTSYHLINKKTLAKLKPTAYLINTARGSVIDEKALIEALATKKIAGAALDVFEKEPLPLDSPLRKFPNVLLSPHNANASPSAWEKVHQNTLNNLIKELSKH